MCNLTERVALRSESLGRMSVDLLANVRLTTSCQQDNLQEKLSETGCKPSRYDVAGDTDRANILWPTTGVRQ